MSDDRQEGYIAGSRRTVRRMLSWCLNELEVDDPDRARTLWLLERTDLVLTLRNVCRDFGDNHWPDDLHLGDVIEKHLVPYLTNKP